MIRGWERSLFDLRPKVNDPRPAETVRAVIPSELAATLRTLLLLDTDTERLVFRASTSEEGVVLAGDEETLDELLDALAAEINHEDDRRRRIRLDRAFSALGDALREAQRR